MTGNWGNVNVFNDDSHRHFFSIDDLSDDEDFKKWKNEETKISADQKLAHTQKLLRMILSNDIDSLYYYSFCQDDVVNNDNGWHCVTCQTCQDWSEWHCGRCDKCKKIQVKSISLTHSINIVHRCFRNKMQTMRWKVRSVKHDVLIFERLFSVVTDRIKKNSGFHLLVSCCNQ